MDECKLFRLKYERLYTDLQTSKPDVVSLAIQLYSREMISKGVREEVSDATTPKEAASRLLSATEKRIESHPRDLGTFVQCLATFSIWTDNAKEMMSKIKDIESKLVQPQPVSEEPTSTYSPNTQQQPLNIRLFISQDGVVTTNPVPEQSESEPFHMRSAPLHRKHPQKMGSEASLPTSKLFQQVSSPQSTAGHDLDSDRQTSEATISEEVTDLPEDGPTQLFSQTSSLSSQISSCSDEDVLSMKGSFDYFLEKYHKMKCKLNSKDKKIKGMQKSYDAGMAAANTANKDLQEQMKSLELERCQMSEELEATRQSVLASNLQKMRLMDQLQDRSIALKKYRNLCSTLEAKVSEAKEGIVFYEEYQKSEERSRELEQKLEYYKQLAVVHEEKIANLEMQIDILVSSSSISSSVCDEWILDAEPEETGALDSL